MFIWHPRPQKTAKQKKDHRSIQRHWNQSWERSRSGPCDLVIQGHAWQWQCGFIFIWHPRPQKPAKQKKDHCSSVTRTRVRKGHAQGHVTLSYKVTLDSYSVDSYLFDIRDPKNLRNKKKIIALASLEPELGKVTLRVTWPCHTRSRLIVTVWIHIYLTSATPKTCETKKGSSL